MDTFAKNKSKLTDDYDARITEYRVSLTKLKSTATRLKLAHKAGLTNASEYHHANNSICTEMEQIEAKITNCLTLKRWISS
jgi:hypothetical protein